MQAWVRLSQGGLAALLVAATIAVAPPPTAAAQVSDRMSLPDGAELIASAGVVSHRPSHRPDAAAARPGILSATARTGRDLRPFAIIGPDDDRVQVNPTTGYPARAVGQITYGGALGCTGFLIDFDTVMTAGHCLFDRETRQWLRNVQFSPGRNGAASAGICVVTKTWVTAIWFGNALGGALVEDNDVGWLTVTCTVTPPQVPLGWFGLYGVKDPPTVPLVGRNVTVQGYPAEKPAGTQWTHTGPIDVTTATRINYVVDTTRGQSGSPVWQNTPDAICPGPCALAVHAYQNVPVDNFGPRITREIFNTALFVRFGAQAGALYVSRDAVAWATPGSSG